MYETTPVNRNVTEPNMNIIIIAYTILCTACLAIKYFQPVAREIGLAYNQTKRATLDKLLAEETKKIFIGDEGGTFIRHIIIRHIIIRLSVIGLIGIWLRVIVLRAIGLVTLVSLSTQGAQALFKTGIALGLCAILLMAMLTVLVISYKSDKSPFKPERNHPHHILQRCGFSSQQTLVIISTIAVVFSVVRLKGG